jgi:amino acid transporter
MFDWLKTLTNGQENFVLIAVFTLLITVLFIIGYIGVKKSIKIKKTATGDEEIDIENDKQN